MERLKSIIHIHNQTITYPRAGLMANPFDMKGPSGDDEAQASNLGGTNIQCRNFSFIATIFFLTIFVKIFLQSSIS